jgi:hypothetical protein
VAGILALTPIAAIPKARYRTARLYEVIRLAVETKRSGIGAASLSERLLSNSKPVHQRAQLGLPARPALLERALQVITHRANPDAETACNCVKC